MSHPPPHDPGRVDRRVEALRRLGMGVPGRLGELDGFLDLVATTIGAQALRFAVADRDVERAQAPDAGGSAVGLDARWVLAQHAALAPDGRASRTVRPGDERAGLPSFGAGERGVTLAAVAVASPDADERIGAIVAHWLAEVEVVEEAWATLERASRHVTMILDLRAESAEYRRFVDLSLEPVLILDDGGVIERANPAFARLLQVEDPAALSGRSVVELVVPADRARVTSQITRLLFSSRDRLSLEVTLTGDDGRQVPVSIAAAHLEGVRRQLQMTVHDLTERVSGEELRSRLSEQLARAERLDLAGQLAGGLAHDLNNLFAVMVSNLELVDEALAEHGSAEAAEVQVEVRSDLAEARAAVDRAVRLSGRLLDLGRQAGSSAGTTEIVEVVHAVRRLVTSTLPERVELRLEVEDRLPPVAGDVTQIERALLNLVLNARDAVGRAGTITVCASRLESAASGPVPAGGFVRLQVVDDGAGMDGATRARVFEPLFTTKGEQGSGLGLPAVVALVDELDGEMALISAPGQGTEVTLDLPAADSPTPVVPLGGDVPVAGARILLVDAGERARFVIERMLAVDGYRVTTTTSVEEALPAIDEVSPALVIVDLALPGGGADLLDRLRTERADLPTLAIAAIDTPSLLDVSPALVKPFSHTRLLREVRQLLGGRGGPLRST
ncbi:MAG: ATP-binding protein [Nitriliruptoraceae bacterium]